MGLPREGLVGSVTDRHAHAPRNGRPLFSFNCGCHVGVAASTAGSSEHSQGAGSPDCAMSLSGW